MSHTLKEGRIYNVYIIMREIIRGTSTSVANHFDHVDNGHHQKSDINPRLTELFFVTRLTKGGCYNPSLDFPNRTSYEIDFGINR